MAASTPTPGTTMAASGQKIDGRAFSADAGGRRVVVLDRFGLDRLRWSAATSISR